MSFDNKIVVNNMSFEISSSIQNIHLTQADEINFSVSFINSSSLNTPSNVNLFDSILFYYEFVENGDIFKNLITMTIHETNSFMWEISRLNFLDIKPIKNANFTIEIKYDSVIYSKTVSFELIAIDNKLPIIEVKNLNTNALFKLYLR